MCVFSVCYVFLVCVYHVRMGFSVSVRLCVERVFSVSVCYVCVCYVCVFSVSMCA